MNVSETAHPDADAAEAFLLARIGDRAFALPAAAVLEVVAAGAVTPLPFAPHWVAGLANLGGRVLPLLDPALLLGLETPPGNEVVLTTTRLGTCALRLTEVLARISVPAADLRSIATDGGHVRGEFEHHGQPVLVLDPDALGDLLVAGDMPGGDPGLLGSNETGDDAQDAQQQTLLGFRIGGARYAMALAEVGEVVAAPPVTPVPGAPACVAGIGMLRDDPLLFVSATALLEVHAAPATAALVIEHRGLRIGLLIDAVTRVDRYPEDQVRTLDDDGEIRAVAHDTDGSITAILGVAQTLNDARRRQLQPLAPAARAQTTAVAVETLGCLETVIGGEHFGIPLDAVRRIVAWSAPQIVDDDTAGGRVTGAVNIDGSIVPVLAPELLQPRTTQPPTGAWVIVGDETQPWALAVDEARRIIAIPRTQIEEQHDNGALQGIARVDHRLLSLVSVERATTRNLS